jgi:glyoxylase-like metal-dependent hydrolase (beta-lactamase superfamily II)
VRHILVTHLDVDHTGGLPDFPTAKVHVHAAEHAGAIARATLLEKSRYRPAHWAHNPSWVLHGEAGEPWFGFACVRDLRGLPPEILLIPLVGHTRGHAGVAVSTPDGWLLHAGDAYFHHGELSPEVRAPRGVVLFQRITAFDDAARLHNQARLRELCRDHGKEVRVISAHDVVELERIRESERARATPSAA